MEAGEAGHISWTLPLLRWLEANLPNDYSASGFAPPSWLSASDRPYYAFLLRCVPDAITLGAKLRRAALSSMPAWRPVIVWPKAFLLFRSCLFSGRVSPARAHGARSCLSSAAANRRRRASLWKARLRSPVSPIEPHASLCGCAPFLRAQILLPASTLTFLPARLCAPARLFLPLA